MIALRSLRIFAIFLQRDLYVYIKRIKSYLINFVILYPLISVASYAYLQAKSYFGSQNVTQGTIFFSGNIILLILSLTFELTIILLFDLENERTTDYRITLLDPRLVLLEQLVFTTLFTFVMMIPFFPVTKLLLQNNFNTDNTQWFMLYLILFLSALCCASYNIFVACILKSSKQISHVWIRCNLPLISLGGLWAPWYIMNNYSPLLGKISFLNPLLYATEGIKKAIIGGPEFFSIGLAASGLLIFTLLFIFGSFYYFKLKVDHI